MNTDNDDPIHEISHRPGEIVELNAIVGGEASECAREIAHIIHAQMGLLHVCHPAIKSAWAVFGKHRQGGEMILLCPHSTKGNGTVFVVSYHLRDDYTVTYMKLHECDPSQVVIIDETDGIYCDQLCDVFTGMTGAEIPVVQFG